MTMRPTRSWTVSSMIMGWWSVGGLQPGDEALRAAILRADAPLLDVLGPLQTITAGTTHTCGLDAQGHAWCWGTNNSGELGDGTLGTRAGPVSDNGQEP